ncbi:MAG: hypothetical protein GC150_06060 [Rhizobiales bacterium]|nr:hypothetical protein [Hyphomicrobiales bacterium]
MSGDQRGAPGGFADEPSRRHHNLQGGASQPVREAPRPSYAPRFDSFVERGAGAPPPPPPGVARGQGGAANERFAEAPQGHPRGAVRQPAPVRDPYDVPAPAEEPNYYHPAPSRYAEDASLAPITRPQDAGRVPPSRPTARQTYDNQPPPSEDFGYAAAARRRFGDEDQGHGYEDSSAASGYRRQPAGTYSDDGYAEATYDGHGAAAGHVEPSGYDANESGLGYPAGGHRQVTHAEQGYSGVDGRHPTGFEDAGASWSRTAPRTADVYQDDAFGRAAGGYAGEQGGSHGGEYADQDSYADQVATGHYDNRYGDDGGYAHQPSGRDHRFDGRYDEPLGESSGYPTGHGGYGTVDHSGRHAVPAGYDHDDYGQEGQYGYDAPDPRSTGRYDAYEPSFDGHGEHHHGAEPVAHAQARQMGEERPRRGGMMLVAGALVAAIAVGAALGLAYEFAFEGSEQTASGDVPILGNNNAPVKVAPTDPGGRRFADQGKVIYERLGEPASQTGSGNGERVIARTETVQPRPVGSGTEAAERVLGVLQEGEQAANGAARQVVEAPRQLDGVRRVPTVQVRPDGTFTAQAPAPQTRVASNEAIVMPGITIDTGLPTQPARQVTRPVTAPAPEASPQRTASLQPPAAAVPDQQRPQLQIQRAAPTAVQQPQAPQQPAATRQPVAQPTTLASADPSAGTGAGGYVVQIAARKSRLDALASFANLQQRYAALLSGRQPDIQEADLGSRGVWYRLRIGPPVSREAANDLCNQLKSSGLDGCLIKAY